MRKLPLSIFLLAPLVALGLHACDQQPVEPEIDVAEQQQGDFLTANVQSGNPLVGTWIMTSAVVGDEDLLAGKTSILYIMTFRSDRTHSVSVSNDAEGLVCGAPSCEWDGFYTYTGTTLTTLEPNHPDPEERGEDTSSYVFCGGRLIFMDSDGEVGIRLTLKRTGK